MCTVSWIHKPCGYELFCNRDELLTRNTALPPQRFEVRGVRIIAPRDGNFGGSWISVNEFGLSLSLLNLYKAGTESFAPVTSRGLLLMDLAGCRSHKHLLAQITEKQMKQFQPFTLLALEPEKPALIIRWNGCERSIDGDGDWQMPLTSSSFDSARAIEMRKENFGRMVNSAVAVDSDFLCAFHRSHDPVAGAYSICMHRDDASTVSFSQIKVDSNSIEFRYHPHSPCRAGVTEIDVETKTLPRKKR